MSDKVEITFFDSVNLIWRPALFDTKTGAVEFLDQVISIGGKINACFDSV